MSRSFTFRGRFYRPTSGGGGDVDPALITIIEALQSKIFAYKPPMLPGVSSFTLASSENGLVTDATMYPSDNPIIAIGSNSPVDYGYIAADTPAFTVAGTYAASLSLAIDTEDNLLNKVDLYDATTLDWLETNNGEFIFGLLQSLTGIDDGAAIATAGIENLQISFAYIDEGTNTLTATTLPAGTYNFIPTRQRYLTTMPVGAFLNTVPYNLDLQQAWREFDITGTVAADDVLTVNTGVFATAGAQTLVASRGTLDMGATGIAFKEDARIRVYLNGSLLSKNENDGRQAYWISATEIAFNIPLYINDVISITTPN